MTNHNGRGLSWIIRILFEGCPQNADLLIFDGVVQGLENSLEELLLTIFIQINDCPPVFSNFLKPLELGQVNQG